MTNQLTFSASDFAIFELPGLEARMQAIQTHIQPKLALLGEQFAQQLSAHLDTPFYYHVAKHARRKVNPPKDTWVSFSTNARGYKMLPHFQIGLWHDCVFAYYGVIYESPRKEAFANYMQQQLDTICTLPNDFVVLANHMSQHVAPIHSKEQITDLLNVLPHKRQADFLLGRVLPSEQVLTLDDATFLAFIEETFKPLLPLFII